METRIAFIDDETNILSSLKRLFRPEPYEIFATTNPDELLAEIQKNYYSLIISDQRMPKITGAELLQKVKQISPDTIRIILTGYSDMTAAMNAINKAEIYKFLLKPWNNEDLLQTVQKAINHHDLIKENEKLNELIQEKNKALTYLNKNLEEKVKERTKKISILNQDLEQRFYDSVFIMSRMAELHSSFIGSHAKRVAVTAKKIASSMELSEEEVFEIEISAILHDVGKILMSPDELKKMAYDVVKNRSAQYMQHPEQGESIVKSFANIGQTPKIIRHHHEAFDGSGFPDGLSGKDIPVGSRIIHIADLFDNAFNSKQSYSTLSQENALKFVLSSNTVDQEIAMHLLKLLSNKDKSFSSETEIEISFCEIAAGMTISRDIKSSTGALLLKKKTMITPLILKKIKPFIKVAPLLGGVFIYRKKMSGGLNEE